MCGSFKFYYKATSNPYPGKSKYHKLIYLFKSELKLQLNVNYTVLTIINIFLILILIKCYFQV